MSMTEQVRAALIAHKLEHGANPDYADMSVGAFDRLMKELAITVHQDDVVVFDGIAIFKEDKHFEVPPDCMVVVQYADPPQNHIRTMVELDA